MNIFSLAIVHHKDESSHTLAILHEDYKGVLRLCFHDISADLDLSPEHSLRFSDYEVPDALCNRLIAIPPSAENPNRLGGLLAVGGKEVHFYPIKPALRKSTRGKGKAPSVEPRFSGEVFFWRWWTFGASGVGVTDGVARR